MICFVIKASLLFSFYHYLLFEVMINVDSINPHCSLVTRTGLVNSWIYCGSYTGIIYRLRSSHYSWIIWTSDMVSSMNLWCSSIQKWTLIGCLVLYYYLLVSSAFDAVVTRNYNYGRQQITKSSFRERPHVRRTPNVGQIKWIRVW